MAQVRISSCIEDFSNCVKYDLIILIEPPVYFSWRISSLNFVAGSDLEIEKFWPDWVLWKIIKNQFLLIFNLSPDMWTGSIRDQYSYLILVPIHIAKDSLWEKILGEPLAGISASLSWHWNFALHSKILQLCKKWFDFIGRAHGLFFTKNL